MHDVVQSLSERGHVSLKDARLLLALCSKEELYSALRTASMWDLKDRKFQELRQYLDIRPTPPSTSCVVAKSIDEHGLERV